MISSGANTAGSSIAARQNAKVATNRTMPSMTKPPPIRLTDSLDARSSPIVTVAILSRTHTESVSPLTRDPINQWQSENLKYVDPLPRLRSGSHHGLQRFESLYEHFLGLYLSEGIESVLADMRDTRCLNRY